MNEMTQPPESIDLPEGWAEKLRLVVPGYRLLNEIARGGQATVYRGIAEGGANAGMLVAVKVFRKDSFADAGVRERFQRELRAMSVLDNHPYVVRVIDQGMTDDGCGFLVLNFIDAQSLRKSLGDPNRANEIGTDPARKLRTFLSICEVMEDVHRLGIVHRDLCPSNILVDELGQPYILDFGYARTAFDRFMQSSSRDFSEDAFIGKLRYASPEQADRRPQDVDIRSDVYALGVILYEILSGGRLPYAVDGGLIAALHNIVHSPPTPLCGAPDSTDSPEAILSERRFAAIDVNPVLEAITMKALQKDRKDRYRSAGELGQDIANYLAGRPTLAQIAGSNSFPTSTLEPSMGFTANQRRAELVSWARELREVALQRGEQRAASTIDEAIKQFESERFVLTVLGKAKRGKSTLLNALLGRRDDVVAPIDKLPASSAISRFSWGPAERATVTFRNGRSQTISFRDIRMFVTEQHNPNNNKDVQFVDIEGPFDGLDRDLMLVDTPGAGSIHEHHDVLLHGFIPQSDAVIFLVTARMPLDSEELDLLRGLGAADIRKVFFVMNRADETSQTDIECAIEHNQRILIEAGFPASEIHCISGKRAFQGDISGSGLVALSGEVADFLANNKARFLEDRFCSRIKAAMAPVVVALETEINASGCSAQEINQQLAALTQQRASLESARGATEAQFTASCGRAIDGFADALPEIERGVLALIAKQIDQTWVTGVNKLSRELPTTINQILDQQLRPETDRLESSLRSACRKLKKDYPVVNFGAQEPSWIRANGDGTGLGTAAAGMVATATGLGVVSAGTAAAAAIASAATLSSPVILPSAITSLVSAIPWVGGWLAPATTVTVWSSPAAAAATPLWVALSGPVGWTIAGLGAAAVPLAWRISKLKLKDKIEAAAADHVKEIFRLLARHRVDSLRRACEQIIVDHRQDVESELNDIEQALVRARDQRPDENARSAMQALASTLRALLSCEQPTTFA